MKKSTRILSKVMIFAFILSLMLSAASMVYADTGLKVGGTAKTIGDLNFRSGAGMKYSVISVLKKGTEVTVLGNIGNWYKVQRADKKVGFASGFYLQAIDKTAGNPTPVVKPTTNIDLSKLEKNIVLATTTSTQDTGLLDTLVPAFSKKYGVNVKVIAVGTGEAIEMGKRGDADVILVHSRKAEDEFVTTGFGINRKDVMYNFYFVVGPNNDPAKVSETKNAVSAMTAIANSGSTFISRGDDSGTDKKEKTLWQLINVKPQGQKWYMEVGQGMGATLTMASELGAYTLVDSGTWYAYKDKVNMKIVLQGDTSLFNPYGVIPVNPAKYPNIAKYSAAAFSEFITSAEGQSIIKNYKKNGYQLFVPDAK